MSVFRGDASQVYTLASDLSQIGFRAVPAARVAMDSAGYNFAKSWATNARATSGEHAAKYPDYITHEMVFDVTGISVDVGPEMRGQGNLGRVLELGSQKSPPHLNGLRALDEMEGRAEKILDASIGSLFG